MTVPEISIIIPVYNVESAIGKTIESVLNQDFTNWELILVDDGSPDLSGKICDEYAYKNTRISVIHQQNKGVSAARNKGLDNAKGKYVSFIDGDDYVEPTYLSSMISLIGNHDAVYADVTHRYPAENRTTAAFSYSEGQIINLENPGTNKIVNFRIIENGFPVAKLFRRSNINAAKLRFNQALCYHEDHIFVLEYLSKCKSIILTSDASYQYIHLPATTSLSKRNHPAEKLIQAANTLLLLTSNLIGKYNITDRKYTRRLYTILGLNQILLAIKNKNAHEIQAIGNAVRQHRWQFLSLYRPNHLSARILPLLFIFHLEFILKLYFSNASKELH